MLNETTTSSEQTSNHTKCVSWAAISSGALVAVGVSFLLYLLTMGLGLSAFTTNAAGLTSLAIGGFIWLILFSYLTMFFAGWVSGKVVRPYTTEGCAGMFHGLIAWCLALVIALMLVSHFSLSAALGAPALYNRSSATNQQSNATQGAVSTIGTDNSQSNNNPQLSTDTKNSANILGVGSLATFFVFLVGAIGSCIGGYVGIRQKKDQAIDIK